uniref:Uncharacterized protein n=1 Tax=viral metagenome TaxID=1070528 RepID=A0A6C0CYI4_9ZZZZ
MRTRTTILNNNSIIIQKQDNQERIMRALQIYNLHWGLEEKQIRKFRFQQQCGHRLHNTILLEFGYFFLLRKYNETISNILFKGERFDHVFMVMKHWSIRLLEHHRFPISFCDRLGDGLDEMYEQKRMDQQRDRQLRRLTRSSTGYLFFYTHDYLEEHAYFYFETTKGRNCLRNVDSILAL